MKYIIFDLEFNQSSNKEDRVLQLPFEIIQIGALKLDENFKTISTFNELVKPTVYKTVLCYIQDYTSKYFKVPGGKRIGLRNALDLLNIDISSEFHNAFNDAFYTAEIFKKLYNDSIEAKIYSHIPIRIKSEPKKIVDYNSLILQIEKMYNKKLTSEEISMIKLAYNMSKTNQFLIPIEKRK